MVQGDRERLGGDRATMNPRQKMAIENHCRFAFETMNPKLAYLTPIGSVVLSVNSGYE